jgi:hypothetical protein
VSGVGDAAYFATVRDRSLASERLAVLVRQTWCLTQAVLAQGAS